MATGLDPVPRAAKLRIVPHSARPVATAMITTITNQFAAVLVSSSPSSPVKRLGASARRLSPQTTSDAVTTSIATVASAAGMRAKRYSLGAISLRPMARVTAAVLATAQSTNTTASEILKRYVPDAIPLPV